MALPSQACDPAQIFSLLYKIAFKWIQIVAGIELPCEVEIGKNFVIDHLGGIVISGFARFGDKDVGANHHRQKCRNRRECRRTR